MQIHNKKTIENKRSIPATGKAPVLVGSVIGTIGTLLVVVVVCSVVAGIRDVMVVLIVVVVVVVVVTKTNYNNRFGEKSKPLVVGSSGSIVRLYTIKKLSVAGLFWEYVK